MVRIRRFGVIKTATVAAVMYAVVILIFVALFSLSALAIPSTGVPGAPGLTPATGFVGILIFGLIIALLYAIFGWIFTALACLLYNFAARYVGGIEIQLEQVPPPATPNWGPTTASAAPHWGPPSSPPSSGPPPSPPPPPAAPTAG